MHAAEGTPLHRECRDTEIVRARRGVTLRSYYVLSFDFAGPNRADALRDGPPEGDCMRRFFTASLFVALAFAPSPTFAGKRTGDGALGAVAGAVVGFSNHVAHLGPALIAPADALGERRCADPSAEAAAGCGAVGAGASAGALHPHRRDAARPVARVGT